MSRDFDADLRGKVAVHAARRAPRASRALASAAHAKRVTVENKSITQHHGTREPTSEGVDKVG